MISKKSTSAFSPGRSQKVIFTEFFISDFIFAEYSGADLTGGKIKRQFDSPLSSDSLVSPLD